MTRTNTQNSWALESECVERSLTEKNKQELEWAGAAQWIKSFLCTCEDYLINQTTWRPPINPVLQKQRQEIILQAGYLNYPELVMLQFSETYNNKVEWLRQITHRLWISTHLCICVHAHVPIYIQNMCTYVSMHFTYIWKRKRKKPQETALCCINKMLLKQDNIG